ncbi:heme peroxidase [Guyanagaster necrorhizus]|uniref:Heme peroxidase n=1 Tax=Guyanagaster necrorhizus TaxID=856835 RepID=A0A9P8AXG4_9AGAR|nr:heme peroxidase [Guyanagaster necrorhizus MCA 3950]KAG7449917.1 heme peroxidase [Guyanagaster necrorhizus MCA 3950]
MSSRPDLTKSFLVSAAQLQYYKDRPAPTAPDGLYDSQAVAQNEQSTQDDQNSVLYKVVNDVQQAVQRGPIVPDTLKAAEGVLDVINNPDAIDDRKGIFTTALAAITRLPSGAVQDELNNEAIALLYNTLPHPPATFIGPQYQWRSADGFGNNVENPQLGRAGTPYARSVQGKHPLTSTSLPDSGLVFDTLLCARDWQEHPGKNSSLTFAFATIVTHSLFRTDPVDWTRNNTSSYLDLSPLYGYSQATQDQVRDKEQGRGLLYPDTFSEERLIFAPPAASALLVIFSRNHNYIANMLLKINEWKRWTDPPPADPQQRALQDEEIFQTARHVNCGHFISLIFGDYVAGFLGLPREGNSWSMNPFDPITTKKGEKVTRGQGNQVSVEFNLLYRWHATIAKEDIKWTQNEFASLFSSAGKPTNQVTLDDFKVAAISAYSKIDPEPRKRVFGDMARQADGTFKDDDLAQILQDATDKAAGAYRARGTPAVLRTIEVMGMEQARRWGCCTMNEFRDFLGLARFKSFSDWSTNPEIAKTAELLYGHIDNLELYPGLQAEDCMPLGPGSGICCGYTMTRAILADAIALVRGDRFYTTDYTPANLTSWGIQDCVRNPDNGAFGAELPKLLFRHLPRHYPGNSVYGLFPFFTPAAVKENLTNIGLDLSNYSFERPKPKPIPIVLNTISGIRYVFSNFNVYKQTYTDDMNLLTQGYGFMLSFDEKEKHDTDRVMTLKALFPDQEMKAKYVAWYGTKTLELLKRKTFKYPGLPGNHVDIVRDVINLVSAHWVAENLIGFQLKTEETPSGILTEQEFYQMLELLFTCVFINIDSEHWWALRSGALKVSDVVTGLIEQGITNASPHLATNAIVGVFTRLKEAIWPPARQDCPSFLTRLTASGRPMRDLAAIVIGLAVGSSVNYAQAVSQIVDFYLDDSRAAERTALIAVCKRDDAKSSELLKGYVREAMRLNPQFGGLFRYAVKDDVINQGHGLPPVSVHPGDIIFGSYKNAHRNPDDFPDPLKVDPTRPLDNYELQGCGFHGCPGVAFVAEAVPTMIKIIFSLPGIRRAPGPAGTLAGFTLNQFETDNKMYITATGQWGPWPGSLQIVYDDA